MEGSISELENGGALHAAVVDAFAKPDRDRSAYLARLVKEGGTCRTCGATVGDRFLEKHPGACDSCMRKGRGKPIAIIPQNIPTAVPAELKGDPMAKVKRGQPKPCCGSRGQRHLSTCKAGAKPIDVPVTRKAAAPESTRPTPERLSRIVEAANKRAAKTPGAPDLSSHTVTQLLAIIVAAQAELERREQDLKEQLDAIRLARAG